MSATEIDPGKLEAFMGLAVTDIGAAMSAPLIVLGLKLGLYKAMAGAGPLSSAEVARRADCDERHVREWLANQVASGYVRHDAENDAYELPPEQAMALADESSPVYLAGMFDVLASVWADEEKLLAAFRSGRGLGWHEHDHRLYHGTERFFRPGYSAHLVAEWIPALEGVEDKLRSGAKVADVGCGHGASTIIMAEAFPQSHFVGFDYHDESIEQARQRAADAGVSDRIEFEIARAQDFPGTDYDLICNFDCLHDMGDPVGAARHTAQALAEGGSYMIVEPMAGDSLEDNIHPVGKLFYAASALLCTPASKAQEVGLALGAQAGEQRLTEVLHEAGFAQVRRATQTPFNMILEARL